MDRTSESPVKPLTFEFAGQRFRIWFKYEHSRTAPRETICLIDLVGEDKTFAAGSAVCSASDQFCKETGRKIALTRALFSAAENNKGFRTAAWEAYRTRFVRSAPEVQKAASS